MSAGTFALVVNTPSAYRLDRVESILVLFLNMGIGILFFVAAVGIKTKI